MATVEAHGLTKRYGDTVALRGVDLDASPGQVLGLLGPNGAGKTTTVRILTTLLRADGGRATVDGVDVFASPREARARMGLTGQFAAVDERLSAEENLVHIGRLHHLSRAEARRRAEMLLERFDLTWAARRSALSYSGGMRRRLDIAMSLIGDPVVLFLDEPTTGLDPRSRLAVWELVDELRELGTTTVLTTQYLDEAERLADEIAVIDHGRVIARGTAADLKGRVGGDQVVLVVGRPEDLVPVAERLVPRAVGQVSINRTALTVSAPVASLDGMIPRLVRELDAEGLAIHDIRARPSTLDDVFFALTGRDSAAEDDDEERELR